MVDWPFPIPDVIIELIQERLKELSEEFTDIADSANRELGIIGYSVQDAVEAVEKLFKQEEAHSIVSINTPPKKYGISLRRQKVQVIKRYDYIPKPLRNQPYQRRGY